MRFNWRSILVLIFVGVLVALQVLYWIDPLTLQDLITFRDNLLSFVKYYPILSAFIYVLIYTVSIIFGIPISMTLIGGYLFGILYGSIYTTIAIALGATLLCTFSRYVIHDWVEKRYKDKLEFFNSEIKKYGSFYIVMIHAIPFAPSFLPHIASGLSSLALYKIILANSFGALPLTVLYSTAGYYLHSLSSLRSFIVYMTIFGVLLIGIWLIVILFRYFNKN